MTKKKYLITNLVYGDTYTKLFCNNHIKSLIDDTNLAAITEKYDVEYKIFTDADTVKTLQTHPNMAKLSKVVKISSEIFGWPEGRVKKFDYRYGLLMNVFKKSVEFAIQQDAYLTAWVADLVVAKEFFPRVMSKMEVGHDAVFVLPLRCASEFVTPKLAEYHNALPDKELCALGFEALHPLWVACHWNNPQFTKLPFTMLWNTGGGLLARSFSTTPIVFKPKKEMLEGRGMIDGDVPGLFDNPYWALDWTDAPVVGVEPLICYYPPFANRPASAEWVRDWSTCLDPTQIPFIEKRLYYPDRETVKPSPQMLAESDAVVKKIMEGQAHGEAAS